MRLVELGQEQLDEAANVLGRAFAEDPLFAYFHPLAGLARARHVRELCRLGCLARLELGFAPLGCLRAGRVAGVACVVDPVDKPRPESLTRAFASFEVLVGREAIERLREYDRLSEQLQPRQPHLFLQMIGVVPEAQGQGIARALLDAVQAMSEAHPLSVGVALDTENPANVPLYEHVGFEVRARAKLGPCDVWSMFRRNRV